LNTANEGAEVTLFQANFGDGAFAVVRPASWNKLPATIQSSQTLQNFKNKLKAHFFWWTSSFSFSFIERGSL